MMTSNQSEHSLCSLLFQTKQNYNTNLQTLLSLINQTNENSIIVAPEVCLTGFDYDNFEAVLAFAKEANETIKKASHNKTVILTIIEKIDNEVFNMAKIFHNGEIIHQRAKAKLFRLGGEHQYFVEGDSKEVEIVEVDGIKIALFVCFELRFKELWQQVEGADIIAVPSWWGVLRAEHFKSLTQALAIINQCYVVASDSLNEECSKMSGIITPQGDVTRNNTQSIVTQVFKRSEVQLMRRYLDVGIL